jgi:stearoyl-CoA desaturase (delta-9 desaturase)
MASINWAVSTYTLLVHVAAVMGLCSIRSTHKYTLVLAILLWPLSSFGITAGSHRLWSHRSYKASLPLKVLLMLLASIANQGSIFHWARDHRVHHKHSETNADPHNAKKGFFFSHIGWLLTKKHPAVKEASLKLNFDDLLDDPVVMFQKSLDPWFNTLMCFVFPSMLCTLWGDSFWNGFWVAGALRYVFVLHNTFLVNSAAHLYGDHPYDPAIWSAENPAVAFLAVGEGWHNWHHKYPFDYAASEYGVLRQYNPTKFFIDMCATVGLASDLKRATGAWHRQRARREELIYGPAKLT